MVDNDIYEKIKKYKWYCSVDNYAIRNLPRKNGVQKKIRLHRLILNNPPGIIDHIDRNSLNNLKSNLRVCNESINGFNRKIASNNNTGVTGVHFNKRENKYEVRLGRMYLGRFKKIKDAIKARIKSEKKYGVYNSQSYNK